MAQEGETRARFLVYKLLKRARQLQIGLPPLTQTRYINTISPEQEPDFPGDEAMELRIRRIVRWNAVAMVLRGNTRFSGLGGHLSTYASSASLYETGFNHFFKGKDGEGSGDQIFYQGHAAPGIYARAFLEGRLTEDQLDHFRRETEPGRGLSSYPHPRLMPDFWEYPTVSMGLGPISAIYQARFNRYLHNRGLADTSKSRVWAFLGDGETDEPESLGALSIAAREGLDNLTFVVNCNLQRLDGPVRGNGKIIQELEAVFRGAGWNVIKVIWAREWDELLARDVDGVLVQQMNDTLDGEFQKFTVAGGAYIREHFFGPDPRLKKLVEHLSDDDLAKLRRGGHDYRKVYAAYKAATEYKGAPTVILAKTVKGWTLGPGVEARNMTHQAKKLSEAELRVFRDRLQLPIPDDKLKDAPYYHPGPEVRGGRVPDGAPASARRADPEARRPGRRRCRRRRPRSTPSSRPAARRPVSTTMVFTRILRNLIRDKELGPRIVPIIPDEARTFGMDPLFKEVGIYSALGPALRAGRLRPGALVPRGDRRPGARGGHHRGRLHGLVPGGRHGLCEPRHRDHPVLHLLLDVRVPADRRPDVGVRGRARPGLPHGRHRRADDADRRGPPARRRPHPHPRLDDPEPARLRPGVRLRAGGDRPRRHRADVRPEARGRLLLHHALQRELPAAGPPATG